MCHNNACEQTYHIYVLRYIYIQHGVPSVSNHARSRFLKIAEQNQLRLCMNNCICNNYVKSPRKIPNFDSFYTPPPPPLPLHPPLPPPHCPPPSLFE